MMLMFSSTMKKFYRVTRTYPFSYLTLNIPSAAKTFVFAPLLLYSYNSSTFYTKF